MMDSADVEAIGQQLLAQAEELDRMAERMRKFAASQRENGERLIASAKGEG